MTTTRPLRLPKTDLAALYAGQPLVLRRALCPQPVPEAALCPFLDLGASETVWGHSLPATGPSHGTLVYRNAKGEETERELSPGRCVTWRPPWQVGERLAVRLTGLVVVVVAVGVERGDAGVWEWRVEVRVVEGGS